MVSNVTIYRSLMTMTMTACFPMVFYVISTLLYIYLSSVRLCVKGAWFIVLALASTTNQSSLTSTPIVQIKPSSLITLGKIVVLVACSTLVIHILSSLFLSVQSSPPYTQSSLYWFVLTTVFPSLFQNSQITIKKDSQPKVKCHLFATHHIVDVGCDDIF